MPLESLASMFSTSQTANQVSSGQPITFKLSPTDLSDIKLSTIVYGNMDFTWISKNVLFKNPGLESALNASTLGTTATVGSALEGNGVLPVRLPQTAGTLNSPLYQEIPGVQGLLSQLQGSLPIVMDSQVKVTVQWLVFDSATSTTSLTSGFTSLGPINTFEVSLIFEPTIIELTHNMIIPVVERFIEARVTLAANGETHQFPLPKMKVTIPAIPIPRLVAFFRHGNFAKGSGKKGPGAILIVVPNNSPLQDLSQFHIALDTLKYTLESLTVFSTFKSMLGGLVTLIGNMTRSNIHTHIADDDNTIQNLAIIGTFGPALSAQDEISSLIYLAPQNSPLLCFIHAFTDPVIGSFTINTGISCYAYIKSLHSTTPTIFPLGEAIITIDTPPQPPATFGDELSSLSFL